MFSEPRPRRPPRPRHRTREVAGRPAAPADERATTGVELAAARVDPASVAAVVPLRRLQRPEEVADLVDFLAAPTGDYITGTTVVMDGGLDVVGPNHMPPLS